MRVWRVVLFPLVLLAQSGFRHQPTHDICSTSGLADSKSALSFVRVGPSEHPGQRIFGENNSLDIKSNHFNQVGTGLEIRSGLNTISQFRCNRFDHPPASSIPRRGIWLRPASLTPPVGPAGALTWPIGGNGIGNQPKPNGNVWPVDPVNSTTEWPVPDPNPDGLDIMNGWVSPTNWTSLQNDNPSFVLEYWAFDNEYVRDPAANTTTNRVKRRVSPANQVIVHPVGTQPPTNPNYDYVELCSADLPPVFPQPLRPVQENGVTSTLENLGNQTNQLFLGDAVPNPAENLTRIPIFIPPQTAGSVWLQVFDLTGRQVLWEVELDKKGQQWVEVPLKNFSSGVYGYALKNQEKSIGARKLVVMH